MLNNLEQGAQRKFQDISLESTRLLPNSYDYRIQAMHRRVLALVLILPLLVSTAASEVVADTKFSRDRGYYEAPIMLEITTATEGSDIYFTTNGEEPDFA